MCTPLRLCVWAPRGVEVFLRPALPCPCPLKEPDDGKAVEDLEGVAGVCLRRGAGRGAGF